MKLDLSRICKISGRPAVGPYIKTKHCSTLVGPDRRVGRFNCFNTGQADRVSGKWFS